MARVKRGNVARQKRKKLLKATKGFRGAPNRLQAIAERAWINAGKSAYKDRRKRRRDMRRLWITRINAAARDNGLRYSEFMNLLKVSEVTLDRKQLAELAFNHPQAFTNLVNKVKAA